MTSVYFDILINYEKAYTPEILSTFLMSDIFRVPETDLKQNISSI